MTNYLVIEDNKVTNVIIADTLEIAEAVTGQTCLECTSNNPAGIGYSYDGTNFVAPVKEPTV